MLNPFTWININVTKKGAFILPDRVFWTVRSVQVIVKKGKVKFPKKLSFHVCREPTPSEEIQTVFGTLSHHVDLWKWSRP